MVPTEDAGAVPESGGLLAPGRPVVLVVSYIGTAFAGFQRQPAARTVQGALEEALGDLAGMPVPVRGAGRTDAGVHALGQVVDCRLPERLRVPAGRLPAALGRRLSADLGVIAAAEVGPDFHARYAARSKRYRYLLWRERAPSPFWRPFSWHYAGPLDLESMRAAAAHIVGRHDFRCFAGAARPVEDAVRTVLDCTVAAQGPWVAVDVEADGFLYRMVRAIAGTLVEVGRGALGPQEFAGILAARRRAAAGPSLPPHGLCLLGVRYGPEHPVPAPPSGWPP